MSKKSLKFSEISTNFPKISNVFPKNLKKPSTLCSKVLYVFQKHTKNVVKNSVLRPAKDAGEHKHGKGCSVKLSNVGLIVGRKC